VCGYFNIGIIKLELKYKSYDHKSNGKKKVVSEIESGELSIGDACRLYDITGNDTIQNWIGKLGKNHLLNKVVRIEMKDEKDRIKELEKKVRQLESALADEHIKNIVLESLVDIAREKYGIDLKKKNGQEQSTSDTGE
jgi:transposase-like protein